MTKNFKPYENYDRLDLTTFMCNMCLDRVWCAQEQFEAMRMYTTNDIKHLACVMERGYDGEMMGVFKVTKYNKGSRTEYRYVLWKDSFGSCSGCDALEGRDGFEYIKTILLENTVQFLTLEDLATYLTE